MKIALAPSTQAAEYRRNLAVAEACLPVLEAAGIECRIFSSPPLPNDSTAGQSKSNAAMQAWGPTLTFALHNDSLGSTTRTAGILVLIDDDHPELAAVAESIGRKAAARQGIPFEEVRRDSRRFVFWEYSGKTGPPTPNCILWENGNMDNPADMKRLESTLVLQGRSLAEAIIEHYGLEAPMTPEQEAKLEAAIKSGQAASYRENVILAHLSGDTAKAQEIAEEGRAAGFRIEYYPPL